MKAVKTILVMIALIASFNTVQAFDLESLKKAAGNIIGDKGGSLLDNILKTDKLEVADLAGTWKSSGSAISFKTENLLKKAGGTAAAATIEEKLNPYYKKAGLDKAVFTFTKDGNLTITLKNGKKITATVTEGEGEGTFIFQFGKLKNIGKVTAYVSKGSTLSIMFDATKLMKLVSAIAKVANNSTISTVSSLLNNYDGLYAGFKLSKQ